VECAGTRLSLRRPCAARPDLRPRGTVAPKRISHRVAARCAAVPRLSLQRLCAASRPRERQRARRRPRGASARLRTAEVAAGSAAVQHRRR
jgi:hypothetical protein